MPSLVRSSWLVVLAVGMACAAGCGKKSKSKSGEPDSTPGSGLLPGTGPGPAGGTPLVSAKKYYPDLTRKQVEKAINSNTLTDQEVIARLGEPSEKSATRTFNNKYGTFYEYDAVWLKAEGQPMLKMTFLNGRFESAEY